MKAVKWISVVAATEIVILNGWWWQTLLIALILTAYAAWHAEQNTRT